jgi:hypothetical protein
MDPVSLQASSGVDACRNQLQDLMTENGLDKLAVIAEWAAELQQIAASKSSLLV